MHVNFQDVLRACVSEGVQLKVVGDHLEVSFDEDVSDGLLDLLRASKAMLLEQLSRGGAADAGDISAGRRRAGEPASRRRCRGHRQAQGEEDADLTLARAV